MVRVYIELGRKMFVMEKRKGELWKVQTYEEGKAILTRDFRVVLNPSLYFYGKVRRVVLEPGEAEKIAIPMRKDGRPIAPSRVLDLLIKRGVI